MTSITRNTNTLLIDEHPLQVQPSLAVVVGLNEAIFLQQLHFWLGIALKSKTGRERGGRLWCYKKFEEWQAENFPFWSVSTIKRLVNKLEKDGLILVEKFDSGRHIQTNFYTISYERLEEITAGNPHESSECQDDTIEDGNLNLSSGSGCNSGEDQNEPLYESVKLPLSSGSECDDVLREHRLLTETTTETTEASISSSSCPVQEIVNLYHEHMPENPAVLILDAERIDAITNRWHEASQLSMQPFGNYKTVGAGLEAWAEFFKICAASEFLTGKVPPPFGRTASFLADFDFLMSQKGFKGCIENKYHRRTA